MLINVSGPIRPLDINNPLQVLVGLPIVKDGKVVGRIDNVDVDGGMWYGTVEEDVELIFPDTCSMEIDGKKED